MGIKTYIKESYTELVEKVSWPSAKDLQSSAVIVLIATFIFALIVMVMDFSFSFLMNDIIYKLIH